MQVTAMQNEDVSNTACALLAEAYDHFNKTLFNKRLPPCQITPEYRGEAKNCFCCNSFRIRDRAGSVVELAVSPKHFPVCATNEVLSKLLHMMVHLEQFRFGTPSRGGHHNKEFAQLMHRVGLIASVTGQPGGKDTGHAMMHYIQPRGPFEGACAEFLAAGADINRLCR